MGNIPFSIDALFYLAAAINLCMDELILQAITGTLKYLDPGQLSILFKPLVWLSGLSWILGGFKSI